MSDDIVRIELGLRKSTIKKIDSLVDHFEVGHRTNAIVKAVRLAHSILREMDKGGRIEVHRRNGDVRELVLR